MCVHVKYVSRIRTHECNLLTTLPTEPPSYAPGEIESSESMAQGTSSVQIEVTDLETSNSS